MYVGTCKTFIIRALILPRGSLQKHQAKYAIVVLKINTNNRQYQYYRLEPTNLPIGKTLDLESRYAYDIITIVVIVKFAYGTG